MWGISARDADAQSQIQVQSCGTPPRTLALGEPAVTLVDINGNVCTSASVSASITGFTPNGNFATLTATNSSASVALPAGAVVVFSNTGTTTVSCTLGVGSATATANENQIPASSSVSFTVGANTFGACIDQTGAASNAVVLAGGAGLFTGFGGGGGSGGGGGAVTIASGAVASGAYSSGSIASGAFASGSVGSGAIASGAISSGAVASGAVAAGALAVGAGADGWDATQGTKTEAACAGDNTSGCSVEQRLQRIAQNLTTLNTSVSAAIPAGTNIIGKVGIDQTTDVTTNGVEIAPTAGTAAGITAVFSGAAEANHVLKASAGNLYNAYATSTVAGYLLIFNATSAPVDGAVTPQNCIPGALTQSGIYAASINYNSGPVEIFTTGITASWSTTGCFTKTASATAFIHGSVK